MTITRILAIAVIVVLTVLVLSPVEDTPPDWTVAPCALWSTDVAPVLPPYTREDVCVTEDLTLSYAPTN